MRKSFKFNNFLNTIDKYAKKQKNKIADEIKEIEERELKKAEADIIDEVNDMIYKELANVKNKILIEVSHKEIEERKKISLMRREMMKEILDECRKKINDFTFSDEYPEALKCYAENISKVLKGRDVELFVKKDDLKYTDIIKNAFSGNCSIKPSDDILIGGIMGYSIESGIIADETLDIKLRDQENLIEEKFGTLLV